MPSNFIDCKRCGAMVIEERWPEHERGHTEGKFQTHSPEDVAALNRIAHAIVPSIIPEDFPPPEAPDDVVLTNEVTGRSVTRRELDRDWRIALQGRALRLIPKKKRS